MIRLIFTAFLFLQLTSSYGQINTNFLFQKWIKVSGNDPYSGPDFGIIDTSKYKGIIQFNISGEYLENDNWNTAIGKWKWNQDSTKIGKRYLKYNQDIFQDKPITEYSLYIYKLTQDTLIIGQQGRHGICRDIYVPISIPRN